MTPDEIGARLTQALGVEAQTPQDVEAQDAESADAQAPAGGIVASVSGGGQYARATVDVPAARWRDAALAARDELGCDFFDWLSAVDEGDNGFDVVAHVWSTAAKFGLLIRTRIPRDTPAVDTIVDIYPGAAWNERETHEMFGIDIVGNADLAPLLLSNQFEGHPLRKDFVLASRVVKPWPGAKEPGEGAGGHGGRARQPARALGVPTPEEWGPAAARAE